MGKVATNTKYERRKERAVRRSRAESRAARDIGKLPTVRNPQRKRRCRRDFKRFCESYFPDTFCLPWSEDHLRVISLIETVVLEGGLFAVAMPRGSGKTSLCEAASIWATFYGHRPFVAVIGPDEGHAKQRVENIRIEIETNDRLLADFPEVCYPIRRLEGIHQRRLLYAGKPLRMELTATRLTLPSISRSKASGAVIATAGITGQIRGLNVKRADGTSIRPSLVILDDPQTDESARSPSQCAQRERILNGAILGLSGPTTKIAGVMPCTVVREDDFADRILDRDKNPQWHGVRTKMVYAWPTNEALWVQYAQLRLEDLARDDTKLTTATEFYRANRDAMDAGARVAWAEQHNADELSALQHAMNLKLRDEVAFFAEYQNEPLPEHKPDDELLSADQIAAKTNGIPRGEVPIGCTCLTAFIDVHVEALYWIVVAWEEDFTGYVIDYGTEPDQKSAHFALRDIRRTLSMMIPHAGREGAIYAGLERCVESLLAREWRCDDGAMLHVDRCLIDANWGEATDLVYQFCRQIQYQVIPSHGKYVGASSIPFREYKRKRGDRVGLNWRIPVGTGRRAVRHVVYDTNFWKSFIHARLAVAMGDPGCLSLHGRQPHRLLAEHLTSEYRVKTEGRGRTVDEWKVRVAGLDNHWFDGLVGCAVAASMEGCTLPGMETKPRTKRKQRMSLRELANRAS